MIDGRVLQSAQKCFEKKSRVVVKMVVRLFVSKKAILLHEKYLNKHGTITGWGKFYSVSCSSLHSTLHTLSTHSTEPLSWLPLVQIENEKCT